MEHQTYDARGKEEAVRSSSLPVVDAGYFPTAPDATSSDETGRAGVLVDEGKSSRRLGGTCRRDTCLGRNDMSTQQHTPATYTTPVCSTVLSCWKGDDFSDGPPLFRGLSGWVHDPGTHRYVHHTETTSFSSLVVLERVRVAWGHDGH